MAWERVAAVSSAARKIFKVRTKRIRLKEAPRLSCRRIRGVARVDGGNREGVYFGLATGQACPQPVPGGHRSRRSEMKTHPLCGGFVNYPRRFSSKRREHVPPPVEGVGTNRSWGVRRRVVDDVR
jgi:hypothetical protein